VKLIYHTLLSAVAAADDDGDSNNSGENLVCRGTRETTHFGKNVTQNLTLGLHYLRKNKL
jgi:hypothetical protein